VYFDDPIPRSRLARGVPLPVTSSTQCDQVVQRIISQVASFFEMMYLQVFRRTTILTVPPIAFEHSVVK